MSEYYRKLLKNNLTNRSSITHYNLKECVLNVAADSATNIGAMLYSLLPDEIRLHSQDCFSQDEADEADGGHAHGVTGRRGLNVQDIGLMH